MYDEEREQRTYTNPDCVKFVEDVEAAGYEPYHYQGRFWWEGPAVNADSYAEVMAATSVVCQTDGMGRGFVVYPRAPDRGKQ